MAPKNSSFPIAHIGGTDEDNGKDKGSSEDITCSHGVQEVKEFPRIRIKA